MWQPYTVELGEIKCLKFGSCGNVSSDPTLTDTASDPFHYVALQRNLISTSRTFLCGPTCNKAVWTGGNLSWAHV